MNIEKKMYDSILRVQAGDLVSLTRKFYAVPLSNPLDCVIMERGETVKVLGVCEFFADDDGFMVTLTGKDKYRVPQNAVAFSEFAKEQF